MMPIEFARPNRIEEAQRKSDVLTAARRDRNLGRGEKYYLNLAVQNAQRDLDAQAKENRTFIRRIT